MLARREYSGHTSIHDDATAKKLGFNAGTIEGPTHFSQIVPLGVDLWGPRFLEAGCIGAHYQNAAIEGEEVRTLLVRPPPGSALAAISVEKRDGAPVLSGTVSIGPDHPRTELNRRLAAIKPLARYHISDRQHVGMEGKKTERVRMDFDTEMGKLYPFSLAEKLEVIAGPSPR